jgi:succinate dehydrogenase/fumarate reductase flavoprotein subunit
MTAGDGVKGKRDMSRRGFIGAAVATLGVGLSACSSGPSAISVSGDSGKTDIEWAGEADVIIMGFGGAGGTAAVEAARQGAKVMLFEKASEQYAGGNSSVCEGYITLMLNEDNAFDYFRKLIDRSSVTDEEIRGCIKANKKSGDWFKEAIGIEWEDLPDLAAKTPFMAANGFGLIRNPTFFYQVKEKIEAMGDSIEVFYETPVTDIIVNTETGEVYGIKATDLSGEAKAYKAKRGVVLACGSFENNDYMIEQHCYDPLPQPGLFPLGTPYNNGDGIVLAAKVGAKIRHMAGLEFGAHCFIKATQDLDLTIAANNHAQDLDNLIMVNRAGKRFMNEAAIPPSGVPHPGHDKTTFPEFFYDGDINDYPNYPFFFIFDETRRASHAIATWASKEAASGWATRQGLYLWSDDNLAEIEQGWIIKADTIVELAEKAGIDAAALEGTIAAYNAACASGVDFEFGRVGHLTPVETGPFYATEMGLAFINAQGGPQRNENYETIGVDDRPIPRLFSAGEFGSIWGHNYPGGLNVPEAVCGFVAGANAAALEPWE